ncbi:ATP-binding protein [Acetohalobium arabaticum]|uniref:Uncharacterized protein n=1 Tax=Acetohalobium arabaticum (strain ATCC 49924 / DSM 5501 / Z-7288) TaxID=574087 RepID=D9QQP7_ACEAZ|nr:ATP-binding protein [Acetohalobium arabaticum]ADL12838.1 protein of unknown function DUF815 [Acetohalobium arabaticum DSM 5501]
MYLSAAKNCCLKLNQLLIYRNLLDNNLIKKVKDLVLNLNNQPTKLTKLQTDYYQLYHELIKTGEKNELQGNLWQQYLLKAITTDKNTFSLTSERLGKDLGTSLYQAAVHDLKILKKFYKLNLAEIENKLNIQPIEFIHNFNPSTANNSLFTDNLTNLNKAFSQTESPKKLTDLLIDYYYSTGTGKLNRYAAFQWNNQQQQPIGIKNPDSVTFKELIGYQSQQQRLIENTEAFLNNNQANNVLLFGASGTGKSSSIKALINRYANEGLRLIEITKNQLTELPKILHFLKQRGLYFIIFMDDLSFEDFETEYKYLKAIMEGGIERKPDNTLFYATSNRRNLIKEKWNDRSQQSSEVHPKDTKQEKLSLVERFGITITYEAPDQRDYLKIVKKLAEKNNINLSQEELEKKAKRWAIRHNGRSGRTAQQFITHLLGKE